MMSVFIACFLIGFLLSDVRGMRVKVNTLAKLPCIVHNQSNTAQVKWYKNPDVFISMNGNVHGSYNRRMNVENPYEGEWILRINNTLVADAGNYTCRVVNEVISHVELVVETPPIIIQDTRNETFDEGDTGTLWCNATGSPAPTVRWYWKPRHQLDGIWQDSGAEGNRLVLHNITRYYDNIYECRASNTVGEERKEIRILVNFGPEVGVFQNTVIAQMRQEVTLHCAVEAFPLNGELEWAFENNSEPIRAGWKYEVVTEEDLVEDFNTFFVSMKIRNGHLEDSDYGKYVCRTKNFRRGYSEKVVVIQKPKEEQTDDITKWMTFEKNVV